jgi:hypothetical protein
MFKPVLPRLTDTPLELQPHLATPPAIDATERFLLRLFLRRYITWRARRRRFAGMQGAARLYHEVTPLSSHCYYRFRPEADNRYGA